MGVAAPFILGGLFLGLLFAASPAKPAPGLGPTDVLPKGWTGPPPFTQDVQPSGTTRVYTVFGWPPNDRNEDYFVAQKKGDPNVWIAWVHDRATDKRTFYRAAANSDAELAMLMSDFKVVKS